MSPSDDLRHMEAAIEAAAAVRRSTAPNPWVGAVVVSPDGRTFVGATQPPGGAHAEVMALAAAGSAADTSTLYSTLEPCRHHGRTGPCTAAIIGAGVSRVVVGVLDPDPNVAGRGVEDLRAAGVDVEVGVGAGSVRHQLRSYLHHRATGRPFVTLKLAATLDGRTAAADGSSQWITGPEARADGHRLRADSDAILVGAGTVRVDDPSLTVRHVDGDDPTRYVLGSAPPDAAIQPCREVGGDLATVLAGIGSEGVIDLLVEGGATVAGDLHRLGLVDRYVVYLAPAFMGGSDGTPLFSGAGAPDIAALWRGEIADVRRLGDDLRVEVTATDGPDAENGP